MSASQLLFGSIQGRASEQFVAPPPPVIAPTDGLIYYYKLDSIVEEGGGIITTPHSPTPAGNIEDGRLRGLFVEVQGKYGNALETAVGAKGAHIEWPDRLVSDMLYISKYGGTQGTISAWVKRNAGEGILVLGTAANLLRNASRHNWVVGADGSMIMSEFEGAGTSTTSPSVVPANVWTHVAFSFDSSGRSMYVNGIKQSINDNTAVYQKVGASDFYGAASCASWFSISRQTENPYRRLDQLRIYSRKLTDAEIDILSRETL